MNLFDLGRGIGYRFSEMNLNKFEFPGVLMSYHKIKRSEFLKQDLLKFLCPAVIYLTLKAGLLKILSNLGHFASRFPEWFFRRIGLGFG
jgi:hypothetical protein